MSVDRSVLACINNTVIGKAEYPTDEELISYFGALATIYTVFSIGYFFLAALNVAYIVFCIARNDYLTCYEWVMRSLLFFAYILMGVYDYFYGNDLDFICSFANDILLGF